MLRFVTSQCFPIQNLVGLFSFPFPSSPGFVCNQTEAQYVSKKSRNYNFCTAILECKSIIFASKFWSSKSSPQQHHIAVCIDTIGLALKQLD